jgi:hypothetical protein
MKLFAFAAAVAVALTSMPSVPAAAQERVVTRTTVTRHVDRRTESHRSWRGHRGWRTKRVCTVRWNHHRKIRTCRTIRVRRY